MASIRKRGKSWHAQVIRRGYRPVFRSFSTKLDADAWARQIESEMDRGVFVSRVQAERTTLDELIERYISEVVPKHRGAESERLRLTMLGRSDLAARFVATLQPQDFAAYRDKRLRVRKPATVHRELGLLQQVIEQARREWGIVLPDNPVRLVARPKFNNSRDRLLAPAVDLASANDVDRLSEEERLLIACGTGQDQARTPWLRPIVELALATAMRQGELLGLQWRHVNLKGEEGIGTAFIPVSKNGYSRTVPLSKKAVKILEALPRSIDGRVFPITRNALKLAWKRAIKRACIEDLTFHDLRHDAITRIAQTLTNILELARVTGHRDLQMLQRYYHPRPEELAKKLG